MPHPLQNRVTPPGDIVADPGRGLYTGNRGVIHDPKTRTLLRRRWTTRAWICCALEWKGARRDPMGGNGRAGKAGWTELFFSDEAAALAAGHRPCFHCRRADALQFRDHWRRAHSTPDALATAIDSVLHRERLASGGKAVRLSPIDLPSLPDGVFVSAGGEPFLLRDRHAELWRFDSYGDPVSPGALARMPLALITPPSVVNVLRDGYRPAMRERR